MLAMFQAVLLLFYFILNIFNIEDSRSGLLLLLFFLLFSCFSVFFDLINGRLVVKRSILIFLLFVFWLILRLLIDVQDIEYIKQLTLATATGVLIYFLVGVFIELQFRKIENHFFYYFIIFLYFASSFVILYKYINLIADADRFYIYIEDGGYQRIGNFMIMISLSVSYCFLRLCVDLKKNIVNSFFVFALYSAGVGCMLVSSQVIGSNAATVNLALIYGITSVFVLLGGDKFVNWGNGVFFIRSKMVIHQIIKKCVFFAIFCFAILFGIIVSFDIDIYQARFFGFGSGVNDSLESRSKILSDYAIQQLEFAPFFGSTRVSYVVTGDQGAYIHSFLLHLISWLGILGLIIFVAYIVDVWFSLFRSIKYKYQENFLASWLFVCFCAIFLVANIATPMFWVVIYFILGFASQTFVRPR